MTVNVSSSVKGNASAEPEIDLGSSQAVSGSEDPEVPFALATSLVAPSTSPEPCSPVAVVTGPPRPPPIAVVTGPPRPPSVAVTTGPPRPPPVAVVTGRPQSLGPAVVYSGEQARDDKNRNCMVVCWILSVACCVCCVLPAIIVAIFLFTSIEKIYIIGDDDNF